MSTFPVPAYMEIHRRPLPSPSTPKLNIGSRVKVINGLALHGYIGTVVGESIVANASEYKVRGGYNHYPVRFDNDPRDPLLFQETELIEVEIPEELK